MLLEWRCLSMKTSSACWKKSEIFLKTNNNNNSGNENDAIIVVSEKQMSSVRFEFCGAEKREESDPLGFKNDT